MAVSRSGCLYVLTSLQIGDIRSYVSRLFLLMACDGLKLVFLVDNGPWTVNSGPPRHAELWQMLVAKSRGSPFVNRLRDNGHAYNGGIADKEGSSGEESSDSGADAGQEKEKEDGWSSILRSLQSGCMDRAQGNKPSLGLYGCVAFEVAWTDVRGINYTNELQTDTCLSLEVRVTTKREFDSLEQAQACYDTILSRAKDTGLSMSEANMYGGKNDGTATSCKGPDKNFQRLVPERKRDFKAHVDDSVGGLWYSGSVEESPIRRRHVEESGRSLPNGPSTILVGEYSRACICSVTSNNVPRLTINSLPQYFTPPSSPYGGQVTNRFKKPKDLKKSCVAPFAEESEAQVTGRVDASNVERIDGRKESGSVSSNTFDHSWPSGCFECRSKTDATPSCERAQSCRTCTDSVYVHPDRLIAPAETYRDTLIIFRFSEPLLPLELKHIITKNRRLLKMLESGLPPWVILLQSYPILCHLYRPWMRPLCGTIYYLISIVTVLIGFYDLYKNVPVLKATAAHICGPLFLWIEEWGMVSRLRYLGTMLFLQNCEKAFEWAVAVTRAFRQVSILVMRPVLQPLVVVGEAFLPVWEAVSYGLQVLLELISVNLSYFLLCISSGLSILIWPLIAFLTSTWNLGVTLLYPVFSAVWAFATFPLQLLKLFGTLIGTLSLEAKDGLHNLWFTVHGGFQFVVASGSPALHSIQRAKSSTPSPSILRALWNDILSKVFHAVNGIVKGLAAFIAACNRHRLSIYNQVVEFLVRVSHLLRSGQCVARTACRQLFRLPDPREPVTAAPNNESQSQSQSQCQIAETQQPIGL